MLKWFRCEACGRDHTHRPIKWPRQEVVPANAAPEWQGGSLRWRRKVYVQGSLNVFQPPHLRAEPHPAQAFRRCRRPASAGSANRAVTAAPEQVHHDRS